MFVFRAEAVSKALPLYPGSERSWVRLTPVVLTLHVTAACLTLQASEVSIARAAATIGVFACSMGFWFWGRAQIGPLRETRRPDEPPLQFRRDGAFGIVRHPLYASYVLACAAPLFAVPRWYLLFTFVGCFLILAKRAGQDEVRLHQQLGTLYADYCREVKRLIPYVW